MDVLDLQGKITLDTSEYEAAVQRAVTLGGQLSAGLSSAASAGSQLDSTISNIGTAAGQSNSALTGQANAAQQAASADSQLSQAAMNTANAQGQLNTALQQSGQSTSNTTQQTLTLQERLEQMRAAYQASIQAVNTLTQQYNESARTAGADAEATRQLGEQLAHAVNNSATLGNEVQSLNRQVDEADRRSRGFGDTIQNAVSVALGTFFVQAVNKAKDALVSFTKESIQVGMGFDSAMSQVAATMGVSADEIGELRDFAKEMGSTTQYSATQAAQALNYMALAGKNAEESMDMLPEVLQLAASGGMDLARASDMITDAQSALGLSTEETSEMVNKMAMAASKSNTSVTQLGDAILQIGGTAKKLQGGTTELATILGILADNGMKGAEGGTHLRNMMNSLMSPTKDATVIMNKLGVSLYDNQGNMRSLNDVFLDLRATMSEMATQQERDQVITTLFNARDMKAAEALLANVGDRYNELSGYIDQAAGSAEKMANTQLDNLQGDVTLFKSAVEGAQIAISEKLEPSLRKFTKVGAQAVSEMSQAFGKFGLGAAIDAAKKAIYDGFGEETANKIRVVKVAVESAMAAFLTYQSKILAAKITEAFTDAATGAVSFAAGLDKLKNMLLNVAKALTANPIFTIGAALAAVAVGVRSAVEEMTLAIEMPKNAYEELNEEQQKVIDQVSEITSAFGNSNKKFEETTKEIDKQADYYDSLTQKLYELDSAENLSTEDKAQMKAIVDELNSSSEEFNIILDKETGHLKTEKKAIDDVVNSLKARAKATALQERLTDLYSKQGDAEKALKSANEELADAEQRRSDLQRKIANQTEELTSLMKKANAGYMTDDDVSRIQYLEANLPILQKEYASLAEDELPAFQAASAIAFQAVSDINAGIDETAKGLGDLQEQINDTAGATVEQGEAVEETSKQFEKANRVIKDAETEQVTVFATIRGETKAWSEDQITKIAEVVDKYVEYREELEKSIKGSVNIFGEFKRDTSITFDDLMKSMKDNKKGVDDWALAIQQLRKKGKLDDQIIDQWEEMGVASWGYVRALNHASLEQQEKFNELWNSTQTSMDKAVHQAFKDDKREADAELERLTGETGVKLGEYRQMLDSFVTDESDTYVKAIQTAVKNAEEAAEEVAEAVNEALNGVDSEGAGKSIMERFAESLRKNAEPIHDWAKQLRGAMGEGAEPVLKGGQVSFPASSVAPGNIGAGTSAFQINLNIDGETVAKKLIRPVDFLMGQLAEQRAKGYA